MSRVAALTLAIIVAGVVALVVLGTPSGYACIDWHGQTLCGVEVHP
jgi:hypothetical protein